MPIDLIILPGFIPDMGAFFINITDFAGGFPYYPVFYLIGIPSLTYRTGIGFIDCRTVIRVDGFQEGFVSSAELLGLRPKMR